MATTTDFPIESALTEHANEALTSLGRERDEAIEAIRASYLTREERIRKAIADLAANPAPAPEPSGQGSETKTNGEATNGTSVNGLSVGKERLRKIENYVKKRGSARQADVQRDLSFNSGTVSTGLRILAEQGRVRKGLNEDGSDQKVKGSTIWFHTNPTVAKGRRESEVAAPA